MTPEQLQAIAANVDYQAGTETTPKMQIAIEEGWKAAMEDQLANLKSIVESAKSVHAVALQELGPNADRILVENKALDHLEFVERVLRRTERAQGGGG